jgi:hypothetical protein
MSDPPNPSPLFYRSRPLGYKLKCRANYFDLGTVSKAILALARRQPIVLVAIDGTGGAGKYTLARTSVAATGAALVLGDYFYRVMDEWGGWSVGNLGGMAPSAGECPRAAPHLPSRPPCHFVTWLPFTSPRKRAGPGASSRPDCLVRLGPPSAG